MATVELLSKENTNIHMTHVPIYARPWNSLANKLQAQELQAFLNNYEVSPQATQSMRYAIPSRRHHAMLYQEDMSLNNRYKDVVQSHVRMGMQQHNRSMQNNLGSLMIDQCAESNKTSPIRTKAPLKKKPLEPPPLCSICNNISPQFGQAPRQFTYSELQVATNNFSRHGYLAEGGFGFVYRGTLLDGQEVAVKQYKHASLQGDKEFCAEVEVLSCAQHLNVVKLIGYCLEDQRRLLIYEFVCNGSLDWHLSPFNPHVLKWKHREKIAVGTARGLRYLHEEVRVGCIVHRDLRPNNILLTHDFTPMVGDFGLARWQPDANRAVQTQVIGTLGYLAPEYAETGHITDKADVYSFGVILLQLITGRKALDASRPKGQQCLTDWARPLLEERLTSKLIDPRLQDADEYELYCMVHAASLCIRKEPTIRPQMRQVLRILEGNNGSPMVSTITKSLDEIQLATSSSAKFSRTTRTRDSLEYRTPSREPISHLSSPNFKLNSSLLNSKYSMYPPKIDEIVTIKQNKGKPRRNKVPRSKKLSYGEM